MESSPKHRRDASNQRGSGKREVSAFGEPKRLIRRLLPLSRVRIKTLFALTFCFAILMTVVVRIIQIRAQQETVHKIELAGGKIYRQFPFQFIIALEFRNRELDESLLDDVSELKRLKTLILSRAKIEDSAYVTLQKLRCIRLLDLSGTGFKDEHAGLLENIHTLRILELSQTDISNQTVERLAHLPLESLALQQCNIDDTAIFELAKMKHLSYLDLRGTETTTDAVRLLRKELPDCVIKSTIERES